MASSSVYRRLFQYIFQYKSKLIAVALISLLGVGFEIVKPLPIKIIIDNILSDRPLPAIFYKVFAHSAVVHDKQTFLLICIALLILITISSAVITLVVFNYTVNLSQRLVYDLSIDFFS